MSAHERDNTMAAPSSGRGSGQKRTEVSEDGTSARRREQRSWYVYDFATAVFNTSVVTVFLGPYLTGIAKAAADAHGYVHPLGLPVRAGSYFAYAVSASVLLSVLVMPLAGAVADRTGRKKPVMGVFAYLGAAATAGLFFLGGDRYLLGGVLLVVANVSYGASFAVYNAFLPQIAKPEERDAVSSRGWACGYVAGSFVLVLNLILFLDHTVLGVSEGAAVRICLASAGVWWALFTLVSVRGLRERAGPAVRNAPGVPAATVSQGLRQLAATIRDLRRYPLTLAFLLAYLIYNDGVQTVISQASLYGSEQLGLGQTTLICAVLLVQVLAIVGALLLGRLAQHYGAKRTVLGSLAAWILTVSAGYFLPAHRPGWFFALAAAIGMVLGGSQALSRSLFSQLVPPGKEAEYFSVYQVSDRGTSWVGPFLFGLAFQLTGSYRTAIVSLVVFFVVGFILLARVPLDRAVAAVRACNAGAHSVRGA
jgi:UMF1 family MFS transporter